jgi:NADH-quinone oxidoreductase subunit A
MAHNDLIAYLYICFFFWGGLAVATLPFAVAHLLRPRARLSARATQSYECGIIPFGQSWDFRHGISYYLYALMFLAFEVDVLFLYPVATAFDTVSARHGIAVLGVFLGILSLGLVYAWKKGVFVWSSQKKIY